MKLSLRVLGPFTAVLDDELIDGFESNKVRALLAFLAVEADRAHSRDALAGLLWPDRSERAARRNLSQALFNLRLVLRDNHRARPFLRVTPQAVQFDTTSDYALDVAEFSAHLAAAHGHAHPTLHSCEACIRRLVQADQLYCADLLAGFFAGDSAPFGEWATIWRERLHRQALEIQTELANHFERRGDWARASHYARRQVELEPWREEAHQQVMKLLVKSGQRSAALQQYQVCRRVMADELGAEPSSETQRLYRRIQSATNYRQHNLPHPVTPFVGREAELRELSSRLADPACRLITLVGPGGIGKTRLAIQVAQACLASFLHGVCFLSLTSLPSAMLLPSALSDALGLVLDPRTDLKVQVLAALQDKEMLLVLDNFEPFVEQGAPWLAEIVKAAPQVKLLVTSRERLNLRAETLFDVGGLALAPETETVRAGEYGAVGLFLQSADRVRAGFEPDHGSMVDVIRICRLVEGMPLAIELAAAWVRSRSCRDISEQIERGLAFLSSSSRDAPPRHRSMETALDHSWKDLSIDERAVFRKLAVFRGGYDINAAMHVAGASASVHSALVAKSLVREQSTGRYILHEVLRQYASQKLAQDAAEAAGAYQNHCHYYAQQMGRELERFESGQQRAALDAIAVELDNTRAACQWAIEHAPLSHLEVLAQGLYVYGYNRMNHADYALYEKAVVALEKSLGGHPGADQTTAWLLGKLLWRWGYFARNTRSSDETTEALFLRSIALVRTGPDRTELAQALDGLGRFYDAAGQYADAGRVYEEGLDVCRHIKDPRFLARALTNVGSVMGHHGETPKGIQLVEEGRSIYRSVGDLVGAVANLNTLAALYYRSGSYGQAKLLYQECRGMYEELGDPGGTTLAINNTGHACLELGEYEEAARYLSEALQRSVALQLVRFHMNVIEGLAELANRVGRRTRAYELAVFVGGSAMAYPAAAHDAQRLEAALKAELPADEIAAARARVRTWTVDDAIAEALGQCG